MTQRTETRFSSLGLKDGFRFGIYPSVEVITEDLGADASKKITEIVNRQLAAHTTATQARDQFTTDIERVTGFKYLTEEVEGKGKNAGKTRTVPAENEKEYVNRFRKACVEGLTFHPASDLGTKTESAAGEEDGEVSIAEQLKHLAHSHAHSTADEIEAWLQTLANLRLYNLDARVTERTAKEKGLPKYALEGAAAIYAAGAERIAYWRKRFSKNGVALAEFDITDEAAKESNLKTLATAIVANESAESANKYK